MKHVLGLWAGLIALAACSTNPPASNTAGPGFSDYNQYQLDQALGGGAVTSTSLDAATTTAAASTVPTNQTVAISSGVLRQAGIIPETSTADATYVRSTGVEATPGNAAPAIYDHPALSDEQDFAAVSSRESIASDAARRQEQAAQYQVVQPTALPTRTDSGPNIVEYALNAPNKLGQEWYSRFVLSGQGRFQRNCARYNSADDAQRAFLSRGGPERDLMGLDPDGDGFACGWDPAPFIAAARG